MSVNESIKQFINESKTFNSREALFDMDVQDYSKIFKM